MNMQERNGNMPQERSPMESIVQYLSILIVYWKFIFLVTLIASIGVVTFSIISLRLPPERSPLPNQYLSSAKIIITGERGQSSMAAMFEAMGLSAEGAGGFNPGRLALEVTGSASFLDRIIEDNGVIERYGMQGVRKSKLREVVLGNAVFSLNPQTGIFTVGYIHIDPVYARDVANNMVENLREWFNGRNSVTRSNTIESLQETIADVERSRLDLEEQVRKFQERYGVLTVEELAATQSQLLRNLQSELVLLDRNIRSRRNLWRIEDDPELVRMRAERENIQEMIAEIEAGYTTGSITLPSRSELPELAMQFARMQAELEIQRRIHTALQERYELLRFSEGSSQVFNVLEYAEVPDEKNGPSRGQLSMIVTLGALGGSIVLSFLIHFIRSVGSDPKKMGMLNQAIAMNRELARGKKAAGKASGADNERSGAEPVTPPPSVPNNHASSGRIPSPMVGGRPDR